MFDNKNILLWTIFAVIVWTIIFFMQSQWDYTFDVNYFSTWKNAWNTNIKSWPEYTQQVLFYSNPYYSSRKNDRLISRTWTNQISEIRFSFDWELPILSWKTLPVYKLLNAKLNKLTTSEANIKNIVWKLENDQLKLVWEKWESIFIDVKNWSANIQNNWNDSLNDVVSILKSLDVNLWNYITLSWEKNIFQLSIEWNPVFDLLWRPIILWWYSSEGTNIDSIFWVQNYNLEKSEYSVDFDIIKLQKTLENYTVKPDKNWKKYIIKLWNPQIINILSKSSISNQQYIIPAIKLETQWETPGWTTLPKYIIVGIVE